MGRRSSLISRFVCQRDTIITSEPVTNNVQKQCRTTMDGTRIVLLVSVMIASDVRAWKHFHLGRERGGNVKAPETTHRLPPDQWFTQKLDHFNPTDERVWQQRYYTNDSFYEDGGPVFLMIGGEGEATAEWMVEGAWIEYARHYRALCFQLEHRYYGKSHPMPNLSVKNLQYLSSQQALADLATFIQAMNGEHTLPSSTKWIAFGGSYPGSLAAWLRYKYPHLVHGAMSASGPLLAQVDFMDYMRVVHESLRTHSDECVARVQEGTSQISTLLRHMIGQRSFTEKFKLCDPVEKSIKNNLDISNLYETLSGNFAGVVQYNKDNRRGKNARLSKITIDTLCDIMTNKSLGPAIDGLAAVNSLMLNVSNQTCLDFKYENMLSELRNTSVDGDAARQWTYQTCTEFGFYQTSSYQPQVFGDKFPVEFFVGMCKDVFGSKFNMNFLNAAVERTNTLYGALDLEVSNVVFVHGSIDPWHALGIIKTMENKAPAIYIQGTAHCANMYPPSDDDLPQLKAARVQIAQLIGSWLDM